MTNREAAPEKKAVPLTWAGWILTALLLAFAALLHRGIGPIPRTLESNWYNPNTFLLDALMASAPGAAMENVGSALALLVLPALATAIAVFYTTRSALARMLATSSVIAVAVFVYYGVEAPGVWSFFHWRWSVCVVLFALCVGAALTAPFLAESWKRLGWPLRLILYLPLFAAAVAFERNVTGTDDTLLFAISPWPVVQVFGLEVFASLIALLLVGVAIGLWLVSRGREKSLWSVAALSLVAAVVAAAIPTAALWLGSQQGLVPFRAGPALLAATAAIALATLAIAATLRVGRDSGELIGRARIWALGGLLLGLPLLVGQSMTRLDYAITRDARAQQVIDALQLHYEKESLYPDKLEELVEDGQLEEIPRPRIGFAWLSEQDFLYQSFGTSYVLEFSAPRWIQCAYNPPYQDEYEEEEEEEDLEDLGGSWSCPSKPPELW
jgi:MFS family permease